MHFKVKRTALRYSSVFALVKMGLSFIFVGKKLVVAADQWYRHYTDTYLPIYQHTQTYRHRFRTWLIDPLTMANDASADPIFRSWCMDIEIDSGVYGKKKLENGPLVRWGVRYCQIISVWPFVIITRSLHHAYVVGSHYVFCIYPCATNLQSECFINRAVLSITCPK